MANDHTLLIADADTEVLGQLKDALANDYDVVAAKDGSRALELSILKHPSLILFDKDCPLIGAGQFVRIIRSNPRTENVPLIVLSDKPLATPSSAGVLQGVLVKPLNLDEVRAHVASVLRKVETVNQAEQSEAVTGSLEQISMVDLLQIFSVNRRTGSLQLTSADGQRTAEVFLHDGRIEEAMTGNCRSQKALYRLLSWEGGRFTFVPGRRAPSVGIQGATDSLLMEGMRQADELARVRDELPSLDARLERLVPAEGLPEGLHPVTAEILELVPYHSRLVELLDRAKATDLEVYLAVRSLLQAKVVRAVEEGAERQTQQLVAQESVFALRSRLRRAGLAPTYLDAPKVALVASETNVVRQVGVALGQLPAFSAHNLERAARLGFGRLGVLSLDQGFTVEFYALNARDRLLPLAYGLSAGTVAGIVVGTQNWEQLAPAVHLLERERRASILVLQQPADPELGLDGDQRKVVMRIDELSDATCRHFIVTLLEQVMGREDLRGVGL